MTIGCRHFVGVLLLATLIGCANSGEKGELIRTRAPSPSLEVSLLHNDQSQPVLVYVPAAHRDESERRFPVVYYLPGFTTDVTEYIDGSIHGFRFDETMDRLVGEGRIEPMIIVIVTGRNSLGGSFYVDSKTTGLWSRYVARDIVNWVDANFPTLPDKRSRGIAGDSMGGFGALHVAMEHPEVFGSVYAISPGLFPDEAAARDRLFPEPSIVRQDLALIEELRHLPPDEAAERLERAVGKMYASRTAIGYRRGFTWAYGSAFASQVEGGAPWVAYPYSIRDDALVEDRHTFSIWAAGFGDLAAKVSEHRAALEELNGLVLDWGRNDQLAWIPAGCVALARELETSAIEYETRPHDGEHIDRLPSRIEEEMLPFFSERLRNKSIPQSDSGTSAK